MLQYSPDSLQWMQLTTFPLIGLALFLLGLVALFYCSYQMFLNENKKLKNIKASLISGFLLIMIGVVLPNLGSTADLGKNVAIQLAEKTKFQDVQLLHLETSPSTALSSPSVSYIGTAKDLDGDPRQFRYTQYQQFGVYEMIGFDKPAVDLKDQSFKHTEKGLEGLTGTGSPVNPSENTSTPSPTASPAPKTGE